MISSHLEIFLLNEIPIKLNKSLFCEITLNALSPMLPVAPNKSIFFIILIIYILIPVLQKGENQSYPEHHRVLAECFLCL